MSIFKNLFKKRRNYNFSCHPLYVKTSCEDKNTLYVTFPDGLRLIFRSGEYVGWYVSGEQNND